MGTESNEVVKPIQKRISVIWQLGLCVLMGLIIGSFIPNYVLIRAHVSEESMLPTYEDGDHVLVFKLKSPERGDVVVVEDVEEGILLIKRVVGMPGDEVQIVGKRVFINRNLLEEPYVLEDNKSDYEGIAKEPIKLKDNEYFVLGDNRAVSRDSREIGPIKEKYIVGVVLN